MRVWRFALLLAAALAHAPGPARADLAEGELAPQFRGRTFLNVDRCDLKSLRGRVVLLQMFRDWYTPCGPDVARLNKLWAGYKDKGVVVLGLTNEAPEAAKHYCERYGPRYPIATEFGNSADTYEVEGFPWDFVIGPDGRIAGQEFSPQLIDSLLPRQRIRPPVPAGATAAAKLVEQYRYGEARRALEDFVAGTVTDDEAKAAAALVTWIDESLALWSAAARASENAGDAADAAASYQELSADFAGLDGAKKAADALAALLADPPSRREIDAAAALLRVRGEAAGKGREAAFPLYTAILRDFPGTRAAEKAAKILADLMPAPKRK